jgi:hypothetical protein
MLLIDKVHGGVVILVLPRIQHWMFRHRGLSQAMVLGAYRIDVSSRVLCLSGHLLH